MHIFFSAMEVLILEIKGEIFGFILVPQPCKANLYLVQYMLLREKFKN